MWFGDGEGSLLCGEIDHEGEKDVYLLVRVGNGRDDVGDGNESDDIKHKLC